MWQTHEKDTIGFRELEYLTGESKEQARNLLFPPNAEKESARIIIMKSTSHHPILLLILLISIQKALSFHIHIGKYPLASTTSTPSKTPLPLKMSTFSPYELNADPCTLPGDPSLNLVTNINLGDKKLDFMKACSKAIQAATGKPEAYIAVSVTDNGTYARAY